MNRVPRKTFAPAYRLYLLEDNGLSSLFFLEKTNFSVKKFNSEHDLLKACEEEQPDLLLVDYDAFKCKSCTRSKETGFTFPAIRVTDKPDIHDRLQSIKDGYSSLISKSVSSDEFIRTIESLLKKQALEPYRVLMVDDDVVTMDYNSALLEKIGIAVERLSTPLSCLEVIEQFKPELILLDIYMPDINGIELSQVIRQIEKYTYIPVIFLSSETDPQKQQLALQSGGEYFISKPVNPERFRISISSRLKHARQTRLLHKELKKSLLVSEQQQITLDEHALVSITDIKGDIIYVNEKFCKVSGYQANELLGENHRVLKSGKHRDSFYEDIWSTIATGNVWQGEICNLNKNGNEYWVDSTIVPFMDEEGMPYQYVSVRTDITTLRNNERRLKVSQDFANIGTWDWNIKTGDLYWSERIAPLFGYEDNKVDTTYDNFLASIHPDDRDDVVAAVNACVEKDVHYDIEHRVIWQDGSVHWLHETGDVIRDYNGEPLHMLGVVRDITLRKTTQNKLTESEARMRSQLDSMREGMFGLNTVGETTFVNQAACVMLGYSQDQLMSQSIPTLILADHKQNLLDTVFLQREHTLNSEAEFICVDGDVIPVEYSSMSVVEDDEIKGFVVTFHDITNRKLNEQEIIVAKEQAENANKAKSQFLSSMSHELRTPMNAILGFSQLLEMDQKSPLNENQKNYISEILNAGKHLLELINEVLDLSKIESGMTQMTIESVSLFETIIDCIRLVEPLAEKKGIKIEFVYADSSIAESDVIVLADKLRLKQVFLNLLSNAVKYNSDNGTVNIDYKIKESEICSVSIKDTGVGVSEERRGDLFQPFNRLGFEDSEIEGTGIGLVITKNLVEMMGGAIFCESELGKGTTFTIDIGLSQEEEDRKVTYVNDEVIAPLTVEKDSYHILYIEDNPVNVRLMAQLFAREKSLCLSTVHEPLLGLSLIAENKPDLILLDINLPNMNGYMVLKELRKLFGENYPVIAVSANAMTGDIEKGRKAGFSDYVTKPIDVELLLNTIYKLLKNI